MFYEFSTKEENKNSSKSNDFALNPLLKTHTNGEVEIIWSNSLTVWSLSKRYLLDQVTSSIRPFAFTARKTSNMQAQKHIADKLTRSMAATHTGSCRHLSESGETINSQPLF